MSISGNDNICIIFSNLLRIILMVKCTKLLFSETLVKQIKVFFIYVCFYIISTILNIYNSNILFNMSFEIFSLFLLSFCYKDEIIKKISVVCLIYTADSICTVLAIYISKFLNLKDKKIRIILGITFIFVSIFIVKKLISSFNYKSLFKTERLKFLFILPVISIVIEFLLLSKGISTIIIFISIGILLLNLAIIYILCFLNMIYHYIYEYETMKRQVEYYRNELEVISATTKILRLVEHDIKHHTKTLYALAEKNKLKDLKQYLLKNWGDIKNKKEFVCSGCIDIDSILNCLLVRAEHYIDKINIDVKVPRGIELYHMELAVILGNLVENGLDALEICNDKYMLISIELRKGLLYIYIKNSRNNILKYKGNQLISTKENPEKHGFGLINVKAVVDKQGGLMEMKESSNFFEVKIILFYLPSGC